MSDFYRTMQAEPIRLYSVTDLAQLLGCDKRVITDAVKKGDLKPVLLTDKKIHSNTKYRFTEKSLNEWLAIREQKTTLIMDEEL